MDLTPYLPYLPIVGAVLAGLGLAFNVRNARRQGEKAEEEQARKVYVSFEQSNSGEKSTVFLHNGGEHPIYKIRIQWSVNDHQVPIHFARAPMLEPKRRSEVEVHGLAQQARIYAAFNDHKGNRWELDNAGSYEKQDRWTHSSMDYENPATRTESGGIP